MIPILGKSDVKFAAVARDHSIVVARQRADDHVGYRPAAAAAGSSAWMWRAGFLVFSADERPRSH